MFLVGLFEYVAGSTIQSVGLDMMVQGAAAMLGLTVGGTMIEPGGGTAAGAAGGAAMIVSGVVVYIPASLIGADGMDRMLYALGAYGDGDYQSTLESVGADARCHNWRGVGKTTVMSMIPGQLGDILTALGVFSAGMAPEPAY